MKIQIIQIYMFVSQDLLWPPHSAGQRPKFKCDVSKSGQVHRGDLVLQVLVLSQFCSFEHEKTMCIIHLFVLA